MSKSVYPQDIKGLISQGPIHHARLLGLVVVELRSLISHLNAHDYNHEARAERQRELTQRLTEAVNTQREETNDRLDQLISTQRSIASGGSAVESDLLYRPSRVDKGKRNRRGR